MNYDIPLVARKISTFLRERVDEDGGPEVPFSYVEGHILAQDDIDRTPRWVIVAAVGYLVARGAAHVRVWKRDQADVDDVKIRHVARRRPPDEAGSDGKPGKER